MFKGKLSVAGKKTRTAVDLGRQENWACLESCGIVREVSPKVLPEGLGPTRREGILQEGKGSHRRWGAGKIPTLNRRGLQGLEKCCASRGPPCLLPASWGRKSQLRPEPLQG